MDKDFKRYNEEIEKYNEVAVKVARDHGFVINYLYAVSKALPNEAHSDPVHYYTSEGTQAFTKQVILYVLPELGIEGDVEYVEQLYVKEPVGI